jgi:hypothetical protein
MFFHSKTGLKLDVLTIWKGHLAPDIRAPDICAPDICAPCVSMYTYIHIHVYVCICIHICECIHIWYALMTFSDQGLSSTQSYFLSEVINEHSWQHEVISKVKNLNFLLSLLKIFFKDKDFLTPYILNKYSLSLTWRKVGFFVLLLAFCEELYFP